MGQSENETERGIEKVGQRESCIERESREKARYSGAERRQRNAEAGRQEGGSGQRERSREKVGIEEEGQREDGRKRQRDGADGYGGEVQRIVVWQSVAVRDRMA